MRHEIAGRDQTSAVRRVRSGAAPYRVREFFCRCDACRTAVLIGDHYYPAGPMRLCAECAPTTRQEIESLLEIVRSGDLPSWASDESDVIDLAERLACLDPLAKRLAKAEGAD